MIRESAEPAWPEPLERRSGEVLRLAIDAFHVGVPRTRSGVLAVTSERLAFVPYDRRPYEGMVFVGLEPGVAFGRWSARQSPESFPSLLRGPP